MNVQVSHDLMGKKITLLSGERRTIEDVTKSGYKVEGERRAVRAWSVIKQSGKLVEVDVAKSDVEDTGLGYAKLIVKDAPAKSGKKAPKADKKADKKASKADKKADSVKDTKPAKSDKKADSVKDTKPEDDDYFIERTLIREIDDSTASVLRAQLSSAIREFMHTHYSNDIKFESGVKVSNTEPDSFMLSCRLTFTLPEPEEDEAEEVEAHEFSSATIDLLNEGLWEKIVESGSPNVTKVLEALEADELNIGDRLVHEDGTVVFFAGLAKERCILAEDEDGNPVKLQLKDLLKLEVQAPVADEDEDIDLGDEDEDIDLGDADEDEDEDEDIDLGDDEDDEAGDDEDEDESEESPTDPRVVKFLDKVEELLEDDETQKKALAFVSRQPRRVLEFVVDSLVELDEDDMSSLNEYSDSEMAKYVLDVCIELFDSNKEDESEEDEEADDDLDFDMGLDDAVDDFDTDEDEDDSEDADADEDEDEDEEEDDTESRDALIAEVESMSLSKLMQVAPDWDVKLPSKELSKDKKRGTRILRARIIAAINESAE